MARASISKPAAARSRSDRELGVGEEHRGGDRAPPGGEVDVARGSPGARAAGTSPPSCAAASATTSRTSTRTRAGDAASVAHGDLGHAAGSGRAAPAGRRASWPRARGRSRRPRRRRPRPRRSAASGPRSRGSGRGGAGCRRGRGRSRALRGYWRVFCARLRRSSEASVMFFCPYAATSSAAARQREALGARRRELQDHGEVHAR